MVNITEIKDLMAQFDGSSLREFSYKTADSELVFSKNEHAFPPAPPVPAQPHSAPATAVEEVNTPLEVAVSASADSPVTAQSSVEGDEVPSPLVGVAYLSPAPDKPAFVAVGDTVKKGQTLLIVEAMKVMNEVPAPFDGVITEVLVNNEDVVEFGQGLVRIK